MFELMTAVVMAFVLEGLLYAAFPEHMKKVAAQMAEIPTQHLRMGALVMAGVGIVVLMIMRL